MPLGGANVPCSDGVPCNDSQNQNQNSAMAACHATVAVNIRLSVRLPLSNRPDLQLLDHEVIIGKSGKAVLTSALGWSSWTNMCNTSQHRGTQMNMSNVRSDPKCSSTDFS